MNQNTAEWHAARLGKLTASKANVIMGGLETSGLASYVKALAWERVYGTRDEGYRSAAMDRGHVVEPAAFDWYVFSTDRSVDKVGFIEHPSLGYVGASPDGLAHDRTLEIKCPLHGAWMDCKRTGVVTSEYRWQCRWAQWVCGVKTTDIVCYHPVAGGLLVPISVTDAEVAQMEGRAGLVNEMVGKWVAVLTDQGEAQ